MNNVTMSGFHIHLLSGEMKNITCHVKVLICIYINLSGPQSTLACIRSECTGHDLLVLWNNAEAPWRSKQLYCNRTFTYTPYKSFFVKIRFAAVPQRQYRVKFVLKTEQKFGCNLISKLNSDYYRVGKLELIKVTTILFK